MRSSEESTTPPASELSEAFFRSRLIPVPASQVGTVESIRARLGELAELSGDLERRMRDLAGDVVQLTGSEHPGAAVVDSMKAILAGDPEAKLSEVHALAWTWLRVRDMLDIDGTPTHAVCPEDFRGLAFYDVAPALAKDVAAGYWSPVSGEPEPRPAATAPALPPVDLSLVTEATRREIYDRIVRIERNLPQEPPFTTFDPDASGLVVFHQYGRWFASWTDLEVPAEFPESSRFQVVTVHPADTPDGIILHEV